jgi:hypothetical protein
LKVVIVVVRLLPAGCVEPALDAGSTATRIVESTLVSTTII